MNAKINIHQVKSADKCPKQEVPEQSRLKKETARKRSTSPHFSTWRSLSRLTVLRQAALDADAEWISPRNSCFYFYTLCVTA